MANTNWRFWVLLFSFSGTLFLFLNRFWIIEIVKKEFLFRNYLEHFAWGFFLPIILVIFFLGAGVFLKINIKWYIGYIASIVIFVVGGFIYYTTASKFQLIDVILDIVGLVLGSWYILSGRSKNNKIIPQERRTKNINPSILSLL